jgi:hypothetical protein
MKFKLTKEEQEKLKKLNPLAKGFYIKELKRKFREKLQLEEQEEIELEMVEYDEEEFRDINLDEYDWEEELK